MKSLREYICEKSIGDVKRNIQFDIAINTTAHAEERKTRHGSDFYNTIHDEEIYELIRKCSEKIIDGLVYDKIVINDRENGRFVIQDTASELNVVGAVSGNINDDKLKINVVTVFRGADFRNNSKRTYTIKI